MNTLLLTWKLAKVGVHLLSGLSQCALLFPWLPLTGRNHLVQRWSRQLISIFGMTLNVSGPVHAGGAVVANHVSWIDVFVLNAVVPCRFVAKSDVRNWPVIGWLSARAGTLYIARNRRTDLVQANAIIAGHLAAGERLAFFPEGTSGPQGLVLPFHANLFQGIVQAQATTLPVAIAYLIPSGELNNAAEYIGDMALWESIVKLLSHGPFTASLAFCQPIKQNNFDRRCLAALSHEAIVAALDQVLHSKGSGVMANRAE
ncbi:MAG: 1-acyl-sn-glycerol-3-phosphate acyltransferase [Pseudomonadota bacterium]|nr:1-acyl-sn-glycerol-3-phosphate acyltransferase [Pseudomonadota bacterium]